MALLAMVIILRFVENWEIKQRLVRLRHLAKSLTGEEIARELLAVLHGEYKIPNDLIGTMHDRASTNSVAMRTVKVLYPTILDVGCFSHTLDIAGEKFNTPHLSEFLSAWITMFAHSPKARFAWNQRTGRTVKTLSKTRWWSRSEIYNQMLTFW